MVTKKDFIKHIERLDGYHYDEETDIVTHNDISVPLEDLYQEYLKKNGLSFKCIYDSHWECKSIIQCTECGTVVRCLYDEYYEPNFRCPTCTDYQTEYVFFNKEQIEENEEIKTAIKMYEELDRLHREEIERKVKRKGLEDYQLCKTRKIVIKDCIYDIDLSIDSILNKNKLKGLCLQVKKWKKDDDISMTLIYNRTIPLSRKAYLTLKKKK